MPTANKGRYQQILKEGSTRTDGPDAKKMNVSAGKALADAIRTTLGPNGMNKMLVSSTGKIVVTNDGASILDRMDIDHPTGKMIVEIAKNQENRSGDGTTTAVILTGQFLREAERLLEQDVHPTSIIIGYQQATKYAVERLETRAIEVDQENSAQLIDIGKTAVTGQWDEQSAQHFAELAVDTVRAVSDDGVDLHDNITLQTVIGSSLADSELVKGLVIDMESSSTSLETFDTHLPRRIKNAKIVLVDDQLTIDKDDAVPYISVDDPGKRSALLELEDEIYTEQVERIAQTGADVVFCQRSIDDTMYHLFARNGILAIERTRQDEMHKLARATGARLVMSADELTEEDVGHAGIVERRTLAGNELTFVSECSNSQQYSVLLRGGSAHVVEETKRIMENCLEVVALAVEKESVVPGGGAIEAGLSSDLRDYATSIRGREQLAAEALADALEVIPRTLAENAGLDPLDTLMELRSRHSKGHDNAGLNGKTKTITDMMAEGVIEPVAIKRQAIESAQEVASMLIRIDDIVAAAPSDDEEEDHDHDHELHGLRSTDSYPWMVGHAS